MRKSHLMALALVAGASQAAHAQVFNNGVPSSYTCNGACGTSGADGSVPLAPNGGTQFGWISTASGLFQNPLNVAETLNGTSLVSNAFTLTSGQQLSFAFNYITSDGAGFSDYAYVRLLGESDASTVLFTARTTTTGNTVPGFELPGIAEGVTLAPTSTPIIEGAPSFSPLGVYSGACFDVGCGFTGWIGAGYVVPTAGTYRLEFGVYNVGDENFDSALAFDYALGQGGAPVSPIPVPIPVPAPGGPGTTVPEPTTWALLASGLAGVAGVARRRRAA